MDVADARLRPLVGELVADRLHQVRLAEADAAVDEKRVVGNSGFSATCSAAARASWFAFPVTKLSNENAGLSRRARESTGLGHADRRSAAGSAMRARTRRKPSSRRSPRWRAARCARRSARAPARARIDSVPRGSAYRPPRPLRAQRPDPGIELLRGEPLLGRAGSIPEVLHLLGGRKRVENFTFFDMRYPQTRLTMRARARALIPPFFGPADGDQADLPTFQDSARAAPRFSRAQPHAGGRKVLRNRRARGRRRLGL